MKRKFDEVPLPIPCAVLHLETEQGSHKLRYGAPELEKEQIQTKLASTPDQTETAIIFSDTPLSKPKPEASKPQQKPKFASTVWHNLIREIPSKAKTSFWES